MPPNCPWSGVSPATIHYCEDNLCAWVAQPANAYSSLGMVFVGLWLIWRARGQATSLKLIGPIAIVIGLTSFAYHASFSFFGQVLDLGSMFCLSSLLIVTNMRRANLLAASKMVPLFVGLVVGAVTLLLLFRRLGQVLFAAQVAASIYFELRARKAATTRIDYRWFFAALATLAVSFGFWILDTTRLWCDPSSHIVQGHAIWHVINASIFAWLYNFYMQFQSAPSETPAALQRAA